VAGRWLWVVGRAADRVSLVAAGASSALSLCSRHGPSAPLVLESSGSGHDCPAQLRGVCCAVPRHRQRQTLRAEAVTC
jgi:hypothetical protein